MLNSAESTAMNAIDALSAELGLPSAKEIEKVKSDKATKKRKRKPTGVVKSQPVGSFSTKADHLRAVLDDKFRQTLTLVEGDDPENNFEAIKSCSVKVQGHLSKMLRYIANSRDELSPYHHIAIDVLLKDGYLATGEQGNFYQALLAKPYTLGTTRAVGRNIISALSVLKVVEFDGKDKYVVNEQSVIAKTFKDWFDGHKE